MTLKSKFSICSSSNLIDTNKSWDKIKNLSEIIFENFGDITSCLLKEEECGIIMFLFFEDLTDDININLKDFKKNYSSFFEMLSNRAESSSSPIIICWAGIRNQNIIESSKMESDLQKINDWFFNELKKLRNRFQTVFLVSLNEVFLAYGSSNMFSERNWYFARCRLSIEGLKNSIQAIFDVIDRYLNPPAKVLVLDCDNTLWGGVIGEDGMSGILLGQDGVGKAFEDFQKEVFRLTKKGILIALSSKNDEEEVLNVFKNHKSMILKMDNIISYQINWNEKADNMKLIAEDLGVSTNSFVFWDDNPLERDKMKTLRPEINTIEVPKNVIEWPKTLKLDSSFSKFEVTKEDSKKTSQYKSRARFNSDLKNSNDINKYLSTLNLSPKIIQIDESNISRAEQLCMKTNQFNLSTKRHNRINITKFSEKNKNSIFLGSLKDRYGDHGIVSFIYFFQLDKKTIFIDTFLMSCRILGRHFEAWLLNEIVKKAKERGSDRILTEFVDSGKNSLAKDFLKNYGFKSANLKKDNIPKNLSLDKVKGELFYLKVSEKQISNLEIYEAN